MSRVDDLFSGSAPPPVADRASGIRWRVALAMLLNLLGPVLCVTSVPGAVLSAWSWMAADEELQRVESGALPAERRPEITRLRNRAFRAMTMAFVLLLVQVMLWMNGTYMALFQVLGKVAGAGW